MCFFVINLAIEASTEQVSKPSAISESSTTGVHNSSLMAGPIYFAILRAKLIYFYPFKGSLNKKTSLKHNILGLAGQFKSFCWPHLCPRAVCCAYLIYITFFLLVFVSGILWLWSTYVLIKLLYCCEPTSTVKFYFRTNLVFLTLNLCYKIDTI